MFYGFLGIELFSDKLGYLTEIYKQSVKSVAWFLLAAYAKTQEDKDNWRKIYYKNGTKTLKIWNSQPMHVAKFKVCLETTSSSCC